MSRRDLIDEWIAARGPKDRSVAQRAGAHLSVDGAAVAALQAVAADDSRPPGSRRREISVTRVLARELAAAGELDGVELVAILAVTAPSVTALERRPALDVAAAIAAAPQLWPGSPLRASSATAAVILGTGAGMLLEHAGALRWDDITLPSGTIASGHQVPLQQLPALAAHRDLMQAAGGQTYVLPVLSRGPDPASISQPERPASARTLRSLVTALRSFSGS